MYVLQQIAANPHVTQAELAQNCSLSVAMVNNYMKELCAQGFVDYQRKSSKRIAYYLTDSGKAAVDVINQEYMQVLVALFTEAKSRIRRSLLEQGEKSLHRVVLYGKGDYAELIFHALESTNIAVIGICSYSEDRPTKDWCGRELLNPTQIRFLAPDAVIIADPEHAEEISRSLAPLSDRGVRLIRCDVRCDAKGIDPVLALSTLQRELAGIPATEHSI
jgi:predicted transcriptional regulator